MFFVLSSWQTDAKNNCVICISNPLTGQTVLIKCLSMNAMSALKRDSSVSRLRPV